MADLSPIVVEIKMSGEIKEMLDAMQRELDAVSAQLEEMLEELRRGEVILGAAEGTIESAAAYREHLGEACAAADGEAES